MANNVITGTLTQLEPRPLLGYTVATMEAMVITGACECSMNTYFRNNL
jgi:hypothetical protein